MEERDLEPEGIQGVNYLHPAKVQRIAESLKARGWDGRRLLVEELKPESLYRYAAWTGTHRLAAAKMVGLRTVPCFVITMDDCEAFARAAYEIYGYSSWRQAVTGREGMCDRHRLRGLEKAGLSEAAQRLREEIEADEW